jgi:hypothetical protein
MELRVSPLVLVYDLVLLPAMVYIWWFFFKRRNAYVHELRFFIRNASLFLFFAVIGRTIDLLDDFFAIPYNLEIEAILYGASIIGVIYTMIVYVLTLERSYIPVETPIERGESKNDSLKSHGSKAPTGAYIIMGSREKIMKVLNTLKELHEPTVVFTRNPKIYRDLGEFVVPIWITQIRERGIPPTALHVIQDQAIRFITEKGGSIIVIDCLEYLLIYNDFKAVFKFLVNLKDYVLTMGKTLMLFVEESAIDERQRALLLKEFEPM